jgi:chromosome partitioning protein
MGPKDIVEFVDGALKLLSERDLWKPFLVVALTLSFGAFWIGWWLRRRSGAKLTCPARHLTPKEDALLANLDALNDALDKPEEELWQFRKTIVPRELLDRIHASKMKVLTLTNLKGGVGKTTLAANLAAYFHERDKRVLLIDFDFQGSLSTTVSRAARRTEATSESDKILTGRLSADNVASATFTLGGPLRHLSLIPAGYELNRQENRMLMRWLLGLDADDPRFALARLLAQERITKTFNLVIIDTPPRLTLATINALCASTHFVVPTILDDASIENVPALLRQVRHWFRDELNRSIELAGVVGTMTPRIDLGQTEERARDTVTRRAAEAWGPSTYIFNTSVPDNARFREDAGRTIAYLDTRATNSATRDVIDALGAETAERIGL